MTASHGHNPDLSCIAGVLAGGGSRRMGRPKALLPLPGGRTIIEHVVDVAAQVASQVVILGRALDLPPSLAGLPVLPDARPGAGPLAGLCSLLEYAGDRWGLLLACDLPCLQADPLRRLLAEARPEVDAVAFVRGRPAEPYHPCCALYHPRTLPQARRHLERTKGSLQDFLAALRVAELRLPPDQSHLLMNVNTPQDHHRALRHLGNP